MSVRETQALTHEKMMMVYRVADSRESLNFFSLSSTVILSVWYGTVRTLQNKNKKLLVARTTDPEK